MTPIHRLIVFTNSYVYRYGISHPDSRKPKPATRLARLGCTIVLIALDTHLRCDISLARGYVIQSTKLLQPATCGWHPIPSIAARFQHRLSRHLMLATLVFKNFCVPVFLGASLSIQPYSM